MYSGFLNDGFCSICQLTTAKGGDHQQSRASVEHYRALSPRLQKPTRSDDGKALSFQLATRMGRKKPHCVGVFLVELLII